MPKTYINKLNIAQIFALLFLASLFFPIRYVFPTKEAFQTGAYSDFTSVSLYLSDIFLFLTVLFIILSRGKRFIPRGGIFKLSTFNFPLLTFILWLILGLIWHNSSLSSLNWWFFAKYLELIVAYGTIYYLFRKTSIKALFLKTFVVFSSLESILALWQFALQKSIGSIFHKIGEQVLAPNIQGVAKIVSGGTTYIRGYGTFPHPNPLSAFLVTSIFLCIYLFLTSKSLKSQILWNLALLINILGLTVTFSRAGYLALAVGLLAFFGILFFWSWHRSEGTQPTELPAVTSTKAETILSEKKIAASSATLGLAMKSTVVLVASIALSFFVFKPFLLTRATITDDAALQRIFYARLGWQMTKQYPIFGVGIGESVLHMQQYSPIKLWPWQIQPVHNYFLLASAELGIPGALILIWIFLWHLKFLISNLKSKLTTYYLLLTTVLISFLVLMQFDHYFYTLQQTQMFLWITLGIIAAEIKNPQPGD